MNHYYVATAEWCGIRHAFRSNDMCVRIGDTVYGKNADITIGGYKAITGSEIIVCGSGADLVLQAMYKGGIPEITRVTRDVWTKEAGYAEDN